MCRKLWNSKLRLPKFQVKSNAALFLFFFFFTFMLTQRWVPFENLPFCRFSVSRGAVVSTQRWLLHIRILASFLSRVPLHHSDSRSRSLNIPSKCASFFLYNGALLYRSHEEPHLQPAASAESLFQSVRVTFLLQIVSGNEGPFFFFHHHVWSSETQEMPSAERGKPLLGRSCHQKIRFVVHICCSLDFIRWDV